jgi:putative ABC transport system permease protein
MSGATLLIAGLVGTLIVFNTMLMGVQERTREIGILLALGWRRLNVLQLVCSEAALLALAGGVLGVLLGVGLTWQLEQFELLRGKIHAVFSPGLLLLAPLLATATGLAGGLYPAWRAAALSPAQALRQE